MLVTPTELINNSVVHPRAIVLDRFLSGIHGGSIRLCLGFVNVGIKFVNLNHNAVAIIVLCMGKLGLLLYGAEFHAFGVARYRDALVTDVANQVDFIVNHYHLGSR